MSLINKMLRDLEDREALFASAQDGVIGDLRSAQDYAHVTSRRRRLMNLLLGGVLLLAVGLFVMGHYYAAFPVHLQPVAVPGPVPHSGKIIKTPAPEIEPGSGALPVAARAVSGKQAGSTGLALKLDAHPLLTQAGAGRATGPDSAWHPALLDMTQQATASGGQIDMRFSSPPQYSIYVLEHPERLLVVLPGTSVPPERFSHFKPDGMVSGVRYAKHDHVSKVIFDMTGPIIMKSANIKAGSGGAYDFHVSYAAAKAVGDGDSMVAASKVVPGDAARAAARNEIKVAENPVPAAAPEPEPAATPDVTQTDESAAPITEVKKFSSENEQAQRLYKKAVNYFYRQQYAMAISALQEVMHISPTYLDARQLLVSILIGQGDRKDGIRLLEQGLQYHPDDPTLVKMEARLLYEDGELKRALAMLAHIKPQLQDDPDYYALMAAILQKGQDFLRAGEIYQKLVQYNPGNGVWWAGLGISLDGVGHSAQALQAFKKATTDPSIPRNLRAYVSTRIKALTKAPA